MAGWPSACGRVPPSGAPDADCRHASRIPEIGDAVSATRVADTMTAPVVTVPPETPTAEIAERLRHHRISAVPVPTTRRVLWGWSVNTTCLPGPGPPPVT